MKKRIPLPFNVRIKGFTLSLIFLLPFIASGQFATGNCEDPHLLDNFLDGTITVTLNMDNISDSFENDCTNTDETKLWFKFTALGTDLDFETSCNSNCKVALVQFENDPCDFSTANSISCNEDVPSFLSVTNELIVGETYYLVLSAENLEPTIQLTIKNFQINDNDEVCNATEITADGSCTTGTTSFASIDFVNPTADCDETLFEQSVWYTTTLSPGKSTLDVNLSGLSLSGDVAVLVGTLTDCEDDNLIIEKFYCGVPSNFSVFGLSGGQKYYIGISTTADEAGSFELCTIERSPPLGCAKNDNCEPGHNGPQEIIISATTQQNCILGCNIGASPGKNFAGNSCFDAYGPTVWYTYKAQHDRLLHLQVVGASFIPQISVYATFDYVNFFLLDCSSQGSIFTSVSEDMELLIAISGADDGEGQFQLCSELILDGTICNQNSTITVTNTSKGSPLDGPFLPGEEVEICLAINLFSSTQNSCQWLHGIVPEFGEGWDPSSFNTDGSPVNITQPIFPLFNQTQQSSWQWYPYGFVNYNNIDPAYLIPGSPAGAGWFFAGNFNQGSNPPCLNPFDPNCSWGDGVSCNGVLGVWYVCFTLTTVSNECSVDPSFKDCSISFRTFGDGETGSWNSPGCQADLPSIKTMSVSCCDEPCADCPAEGLDATNEWISSVSFNDFLNESGAAGYSDFTDQIIDLQIGENEFTLEASFDDLEYNEYWKIWIDFNADGDFKDAGEELYSNASLPIPLNGSINIPSYVSGNYTMRIAMSFDAPPLPCSKFAYGEVEDYTVQFINCTAPTASNVEYLSNNQVKISWESFEEASLYRFQYRQVGTNNWIQFNTADNFVILSNLEEDAIYKYSIRARCPMGWTPWGEKYNFMTDPAICSKPSPKDIQLAPDFVVMLILNPMDFASQYKLRYRPLGASDWIELDSDSEEFTLDELSPDIIYEYQLNAFCTNTDNWTGFSKTYRLTSDGFLMKAIPQSSAVQLTVSPNPSSGEYLVEFSGLMDNSELTLISMDGRKLQSQLLQAATTRLNLDLSLYSSGIYFLRVNDGIKITTQKLILVK